MFDKTLREEIEKKLHNDELKYIGSGAARDVYALDENYVVKTLRPSSVENWNERYLENHREELIEIIEKEDFEHEHALEAFYNVVKDSFDSNKELIDFYLSFKWAAQSITEYLIWEEFKDFQEAKDHLTEVFDIFINTDKTNIILVQERGEPFKDNQSDFMEGERKLKEAFGSEEGLSKAKNELYCALDSIECGVSDSHTGNYVLGKNGKLKICDFGIDSESRYCDRISSY